MADQTKVYLCRYQVASLIFMLNSKKVTMDSSNILSIEKVDDYEYNIRSVLKLSLRIDIRKKLWLLKNKDDIVCKFELDKIGMDTDGEEYVTGTESAWNMEFGIYFSDDDAAIDTNSLEERLDMNDEGSTTSDTDSEDYYESENQLDVYLFNSDLLNASKKTYNEVFTKDTLQNCIGRLLTQTKHKKVLMSRVENSEVYEELLIPPNPAYKGLIYLDEYYGLYKTGALIYYDLDTLYILNTNGKVTAKRSDEWTSVTFMVTETDDSTPGNGMIRKNGEKKYYINVPEDNVNPQKFSESNNASLGSAAKLIVTDDTTVDLSEANQSYVDQRNEYIKYIKSSDNKYQSSIITARMEENECVMYINADNIDINAFTPNKEYQLVFSETTKQTKYGKYKYRLAYAYHYIKMEGESYMTSSHRIILKKCSS